MLVRSEQAKWALSERTATRITLQLGSKRQSYELTRAEFEAMTFPLMDRTRRLTEEALGEAGLDWHRLDGVLLVGGSTRMPMVRALRHRDGRQAAPDGCQRRRGRRPGRGHPGGDRGRPADRRRGAPSSRFDRRRDGPRHATASRPAGHRRDVAQPGHDRRQLGRLAAIVNDIVIRRNIPIPAQNTKTYIHATHGGANTRLEVYLTQGESAAPLDCTILGKYVFTGIHATDAEVMVDVGLSYDVNGVVQVQAVQRDTGHRLALDRRAGARRPVMAGPAARGRASSARPSGSACSS